MAWVPAVVGTRPRKWCQINLGFTGEDTTWSSCPDACNHTGGLAVKSEVVSERDELEARTILTFALHAFVLKNDDNSQDRMVDARFHGPDGTSGVIEIFADHVEGWAEYIAFLANNRTVPAPELQRRWRIGVFAQSKLQSRKKQWITGIRELEHTGHTNMVEAPDVIREMLFQIGIQHANVRLGEPGALELQRQITGSLADPELASLLSRYLDHLLDGIARRKTSKLLAHRDPVDERHLFIWITESSPMDIAAMLRDVPEDLQSHVAPNLPEGITNLWIAGQDLQMHTLEWSQDRGWFDWGWPPRNEKEAVEWANPPTWLGP